MTFIGFLAEKKDENNLKKTLKTMLEDLGIKAMVVSINEKSIENLKNIRFETIIINRNIDEHLNEQLKKLLKLTKYLIVNNDIVNMEKIKNVSLTVITYGFGSKCTITASSVDEENILLCLQRSIYNIKNIKIEPQEIKSSITEKTGNQYLKMAIATVELLYNFKKYY